MSENLLIRSYRTGCGDCIFIRIPDEERPFHILIDCGNYYGQKIAGVRNAVTNIHFLLKDEAVPQDHRGKLDLIVATHQHWDHIKGFESEHRTLKEIEVKRVWLPIAMKEDHPQNANLQLLHRHIDTTIAKFVNAQGLALNPNLHSFLMMMKLSRANSTDAIVNDIPRQNNISPLYIYRGFQDHLSDDEKRTHLLDFKDPETELIVLAPENDIDEAYVGDVAGLLHEIKEGEYFFSELSSGGNITEIPINISMRDFRNLKNNIMYTTLLAALAVNEVDNNTSIVLLLKWKGRRLLFAGDAEKESWKIMWEKMKSELSEPIDFLKVSHHGSHTGTPYDLNDCDASINQILNSILPISGADKAQAVVSTEADVINAPIYPVPLPELMNELAKRVKNTRIYDPTMGPEPQRTDKEEGEWVDIIITPKTQ